MKSKLFEETAERIVARFKDAEKILIISSNPVDADTLGTVLSLQWLLLKKYRKDSEIVTFVSIPSTYKTFNGIERIETPHLGSFNFNPYDLIVCLDANAWSQIFSRDLTEIFTRVDKSKIVHIDHHPAYDIHNDLNEYSLDVEDESCAAKVLFDYFLEDKDIVIPNEVVNWLYDALIYDTGRFQHAVNPDTFDFAQKLIKLGADHNKAVNINFPMGQIKYAEWALKKMTYYPELQTTILTVEEPDNIWLKENIDKQWSLNQSFRFYMENILRRIEGYNYGIIFNAKKSPFGVSVSWRTRSYGEFLSMQSVLEAIGFTAGGHFGAGGGFKKDETPKNAEKLFIEEIRKRLNTITNY